MREAEEGDGGKVVEEGVTMMEPVPLFSVEGTTSCDRGGVGALGEEEGFFTFDFLARVGLDVDLGLTFLRG